jgi:tetratricopeptide (TPR) repeat protein
MVSAPRNSPRHLIRVNPRHDRLGDYLVALQLTRKAPDFTDGWNALGVALSGMGKQEEAEKALKKSLELDPENGYTLKSLGALIGKSDPKEALPHLKRAAELLPSDQASQYGYAKALMESGSLADADPVLNRAIALNEHFEIAERCREASTRIAHLKMRAGDAGIDFSKEYEVALKMFKGEKEGSEPEKAI